MARTGTHRPKRQHSLYLLSERIYSGKRCFYCGGLLRGNRTREHVFPRWLQERFGLANQHLTLLNGTLIPYRQLTVPCCQTCNNVYLSKLEKRVQTLLFDSSIAAARRDLKDIYILGKTRSFSASSTRNGCFRSIGATPGGVPYCRILARCLQHDAFPDSEPAIPHQVHGGRRGANSGLCIPVRPKVTKRSEAS